MTPKPIAVQALRVYAPDTPHVVLHVTFANGFFCDGHLSLDFHDQDPEHNRKLLAEPFINQIGDIEFGNKTIVPHRRVYEVYALGAPK